MTDLVLPEAQAYAEQHTTPPAGVLADVAAWTQSSSSVPQMMSGLPEARLLELLIVASGAMAVLEIGTFTGFGALAMAGALPPGGRVTTLEVDTDTARDAQRHFDASPHGDRIELIVGNALEVLGDIPGPFDLVYIDAWKSDYPAYYDLVLPKLSERGVIVADNLFRGGLVLGLDGDPSDDDEGTAGLRAFAQQVQDDPRVHNVLLTIGDGQMLAWRAPQG
jgi:caffeoyl-CoA O-methyltransferase